MDNHVHLIAVPQQAWSLAKGIGEAHRKYTNAINIRENWRGFLWQGRFLSYPLDEARLYNAVRYIERNPVRAGVVKKAEQYSWSSAKAHILGAPDPLLSMAGFPLVIKDWASYLREADNESDVMRMREHERNGRPLGDASFIQRLEQITGRVLAPQKRGRKKG
jgi:REP-associated tyrosine transposase